MADTTAPILGTGLAIAGMLATMIVTLTLPAATDNVDAPTALRYKIYKDGGGTALATGLTGPTWSETVTADGTTHGYQVTAVDTAGNECVKSAIIRIAYTLNVLSSDLSLAKAAAVAAHAVTNGNGKTVNASDVFVSTHDGGNVERVGGGIVTSRLTYSVAGGYRTDFYDASNHLVSSTFQRIA